MKIWFDFIFSESEISSVQSLAQIDQYDDDAQHADRPRDRFCDRRSDGAVGGVAKYSRLVQHKRLVEEVQRPNQRNFRRLATTRHTSLCLQIHVTPLENVTQYKSEKCCSGHPTTSAEPPDPTCEPNELLGRALKRKFTELDEITQRLRLRLSKVTNDESDTSNDEIADEFERDINTLCVEDDFDMVDFEEEAHVFNVNREVGLLRTDQMLVEGKQKIDQLLEKLSLMSGENSSRYVSGCSDVRLDTEAIFNELDSGSRPNLYSSASFSREMEQKFGSFGNSESSSVGSERRAGPEGEGHVTEAKAND